MKWKNGIDATTGLLYPPPALTRWRNTSFGLATAALLAACGGDSSDAPGSNTEEDRASAASLIYSYPLDGQTEVPTPSPVVLRFSSPVNITTAAVVDLVELRDANGDPVSWGRVEEADKGQSMLFFPEARLAPRTEYQLSMERIDLKVGGAEPRTLTFLTRTADGAKNRAAAGAFEGPGNLVAADDFEVIRMIPDGESQSVMDFSSFRVQFSQPLDQTTVKYGDGADATVQLMGPSGLVDAHLLTSGPYLTVDPKEDLTPGVQYSLNLTTGITSAYGGALPRSAFGNPDDTGAVSFKATPLDTTSPTTGERESMVMDVANTEQPSELTGKPINLVPMASMLLGEDTATQASGTIASELAYAPNFPDAVPLRIKRGSLIEGETIQVLIGGEVPAGFKSGKVSMEFLSDATGYLLPNPYSDADDAPRQVRLWMDVAVSTETPEANGAITQNLLHIELVGTSLVEDQRMVINAVGVVEPDVLGTEPATGLLSFYMQEMIEADNPPQVGENRDPLELQSWTHKNTRSLSLGDAIVLNFNKAISHDSVGEIRLVEHSLNGQNDIPVDVYTRGAALVIEPREMLRRPYQLPAEDPVHAQMDQISYSVHVNNDISGINGGAVDIIEPLEFAFDAEISELAWSQLGYLNNNDPHTINDVTLPANGDLFRRFMDQSVAVLLAYPGFPCAMDTSEQNIADDIAGRCRGSLSTPYLSQESRRDIGPDDLLPIPTLASNQSVVVYGSQEFLPESVALGQSFTVEEVNEDGSHRADVAGQLSVEGTRITFTPVEPWQPGTLYRYTLRSNGDDLELIDSADDIAPAVCDGSQAICDLKERPLKTQFQSVSVNSTGNDGRIVQRAAWAQSGGPDMAILFRAAESTDNVLQALVAKSVDTNANFYHDVDSGPIPSRVDQALDYVFTHRTYGSEEQGVDTNERELQPHPYDPAGIQTIPNSVKVLSKPWSPIVLATDENGNPLVDEKFRPIMEEGYVFNALHVGCGFLAMDPPLDFMDIVGAFQTPYTPQECPENKFIHLHSALAAEVSGYEEGKGIKVDIWPSQIIGSSVVTTVLLQNMIANTMDSGLQMMRIRYAKDDPTCVETSTNVCSRTKPQQGWITFENGKPVLNADVDLYIDAVGLGSNIHLALGDINHNLVSVPRTMTLKGGVTFTESGQMIVDQISQNEVNIGFDLEQLSTNPTDPTDIFQETVGHFELIIPEGGTHIRYVSEVIK